MRAPLPPTDRLIGKTIEALPEHVISDYIGSGANARVFKAIDEATSSVFAFKFVPRGNLVIHPKPNRYLEEPRRANQLESRAVVKHHQVAEYADEDIDCIVFVCDFVEGDSLRRYIERKSMHKHVDISFIESYLRTMLELLHEMTEVGIVHGDLHPGNVIVNRPRYSLPPRTDFRVTDFGLRRLSTPDAVQNDYLSVAHTLHALLSCIDYRDLASRDRFYYNVIRNEIQYHLLEQDTTRDPCARSAQAIYNKLGLLETRYRRARELNHSLPRHLDSPFDYPNCEQIGKSHLLFQSLYSSRLLGLEEIASRSNLVLTGPRGCGKTTVFRALSLEHLTSTEGDKPDEVPYLGIYYGCDDLYFAFPRYKRPSREELIDVPIHFLIATLLARLLEQLSEWALKYFASEWRHREHEAAGRLIEVFQWEATAASSGTFGLSSIIRRLRGRERRRAVDKQRFGEDLTQKVGMYFGPNVMIDACRVVREEFGFLEDRPFHFFIDDYSKPKITDDLQLNLNRLLMIRTEGIFFKVSTESPVSFVRRDIDGKTYVEGREYDFVNLGLRYITDSSERALPFIEDIFERRFRMVQGYPVSNLDQLLGSMPRNENALARVFRDEANDADREKYNHYAGKETVAAMCSGDIHYVIRLVARMVEEFGGRDALRNSSEVPVIPAQEQTNAIRAAAGSFMEQIRTLPNVGLQLSEVVGAFGQVARSYLIHRTAKNRTATPAHQASRIEPYEALQLSEPAQHILDELLRYSIFIEDPRGKSRRGRIVPRFYLRRYLIPHFNLTFSKRDSIELTSSGLQRLLLAPGGFENQYRLREHRAIWDRSLEER